MHKPSVNLWVYNHLVNGISDQIQYFVDSFREYGYVVTVSRQPNQTCLNFVIENFSTVTSRRLINFCQSTSKRVGLIMTEHLDLVGRELLMHGKPLWSMNDYMAPGTQVSRIKNMFDCIEHFSGIFVLGDLPELVGSNILFPNIPVKMIPFPKLTNPSKMDIRPISDFLFTGYITSYRKDVIDQLKKQYTVTQPSGFVTRKQRHAITLNAKFVLNIPQSKDWAWLSLMRIIAALNSGRATLSIGTTDNSCISECTVQVPPDEFNDYVSHNIDNWRGIYEECSVKYESMRLDFNEKNPFPHPLLEMWARIENVKY